MSRAASASGVAPDQAELPRLQRDGASHASGCRCPRCRGWVEDPVQLRARAEAALARRRERRRAKALALELDLAEGERRTNEYLRRQAAIAQRLREDHRLDLLLAARDAGKPAAEAIAEVERRFREVRG